MSCSQLSEGRELELALWAGGDLPAAEAELLEDHLAACPECRALASGLRESQAGLAALTGEPIDPEALARVRTGVLRRLEERRPRPAMAPWLMAAAATLAVAALALGLWLQGSRPAGTPEVAARAEDASPTSAAGLEQARPEPEDRGIDSAPRRAEERIAVPEAPPAPEPPVQRAAVPPAEPSATESMVIQIVSENPDIVFYWLVEPEENEDEAISS